jgi:hypothetical protein
VFAATIWLLAGFYDAIDIDKAKKPKTVEWKASIPKILKNPDEFLLKL